MATLAKIIMLTSLISTIHLEIWNVKHHLLFKLGIQQVTNKVIFQSMEAGKGKL